VVRDSGLGADLVGRAVGVPGVVAGEALDRVHDLALHVRRPLESHAEVRPGATARRGEAERGGVLSGTRGPLVHAAPVGGDRVPRCAQSTIRSAISDTNVSASRSRCSSLEVFGGAESGSWTMRTWPFARSGELMVFSFAARTYLSSVSALSRFPATSAGPATWTLEPEGISPARSGSTFCPMRSSKR